MKKNNVPIPKDFNVSFFKKSITNPISRAGKEVSGIYSETTGGVERFFKKQKGEQRVYMTTLQEVSEIFSLTYGETQGILVSVS